MSKNIIFNRLKPLGPGSGICMPTVRLSENNSITFPPEIMQKLGFKPGDSLTVEEVNGELVVRPVRPVAALPAKPAAADGKNLKDAISRKNLETGIQFI